MVNEDPKAPQTRSHPRDSRLRAELLRARLRAAEKKLSRLEWWQDVFTRLGIGWFLYPKLQRLGAEFEIWMREVAVSPPPNASRLQAKLERSLDAVSALGEAAGVIEEEESPDQEQDPEEYLLPAFPMDSLAEVIAALSSRWIWMSILLAGFSLVPTIVLGIQSFILFNSFEQSTADHIEATRASLFAHSVAIQRMWVEHPQTRKYFMEGEALALDAPEELRAQVATLAEACADMLDHAANSSMRGHEGWGNYTCWIFNEGSPALRNFLCSNQGWYPSVWEVLEGCKEKSDNPCASTGA